MLEILHGGSGEYKRHANPLLPVASIKAGTCFIIPRGRDRGDSGSGTARLAGRDFGL
jgi:hypothetical protein